MCWASDAFRRSENEYMAVVVGENIASKTSNVDNKYTRTTDKASTRAATATATATDECKQSKSFNQNEVGSNWNDH